MASWFVFACFAFTGFCFLLLALLLGGGETEADALDGADASVDAGGADGGGEVVDKDSLSGDLAGWFSVRVLAAFAVGFGLGGMVASLAGLWWPVAAFVGLPCGWLLGFVAKAFMEALLRSQSSSHTKEEQLLFQQGIVTQTILPGRIGEVEVRQTYRAARAASNEQITAGSSIRVVELGEILVVRPDDVLITAEKN